MNKPATIGASILLCAALVSCKTSKILSANFESDAVGSPPATNLPGDPAGDVIQFDPGLTPQLAVVNSATAGEKALNFRNMTVAIPSGHNRWLNFRGISTNLVETLWFVYNAKNTSATSNVLIDVSDGSGHLMARMRIQSSGDVGLATNILDNYSNVIGNVGSGSHTIIFTVMPSTLKYNVSIYPSSGPVITAENKPMITENALEFANPAHPSVSFQHESTSGSGGHQYIIESVSISRKKP